MVGIGSEGMCGVGNEETRTYVGVWADIADGDEKLMLGLVWSLIARYHIEPALTDLPRSSSLYSFVTTTTRTAIKTKLIQWTSRVVDPTPVNNLTLSFSDGIVLSKLVNHIQPGTIEVDSLDPVCGIGCTRPLLLIL